MLKSFLRERIRQQLLSQTQHELMKEYLAQPQVNSKQPATKTEYLALDLEMSGMDAQQDVILSIGYVPIIDRQVILADARHHYIQHDHVNLHATAPIHNIRNIDLVEGTELESAMNELLLALRGRVLVLHHAPLDTSFLNHACRQIYGTELLAPTLDTLQIEHKRSQRKGLATTPGMLRLHACRQRYGLPPALAHNAVSDAIATAELWLAQLSQISMGKPLKLAYFL